MTPDNDYPDSTISQALAFMRDPNFQRTPILGTMARGIENGANVVDQFQQNGTGAGLSAAVEALLKSLDEPRQILTRAVGLSPESIDRAGADVAQALGAPRGLGQFAANTLTDPLNYLGVGAFGGLAKGAARIGLRESNPFVGLLRQTAVADKQVSDAGERAAKALVKGMQDGLIPVNDTLGKVFPSLPAWGQYAKQSKNAAEVSQWLQERHGLDLSNARATAQSNGIDALHQLLPTEMGSRFSPDDLQSLLGSGGKNAASFDDAERAYLGAMRDSLGLNTDSKFQKFYLDFTNWWKRQALGSIGYLSSNAAGGTLFGALEGVKSGDIARDLWSNREDILRGKPFDIEDAAKLRDATGTPIPAGLDFNVHASANANAGAAGLKPNASDILGVGALGALSDGLLGAVTGGATGALLGPLTGKVRQISQGIETVLRQRGYHKGMSDALVDNMAEVDNIVRGAASRANPQAGMTPDALTDLLMQGVKSNGGAFSAESVGSQFGHLGNADHSTVEELKRLLDDHLYRASQAGVKTSNASNFDYGDLSNLERALTTVFPFATWYMKALPFVAEHAGKTPGLLSVPREWDTAAHDNREANGLTARVEGALPNPIGSVLLSHMLGRDVTAYQNPFSQFLPMADVSRGMANLEYSNGPVDTGLGILDALGLGLNPLIDTALRVAGARGTDVPSEGIPLRVGGVVNALTSVDLNQPGRDIESAVRRNLTGKEPTDLNQVAVAKRLDELALRETGRTIGSGDSRVAPYVRAKAQQSGTLWSRAQQEVNAERNLSAVGGFISPSLRPQTLVTPEEEAIRGAAAHTLVPQEASKQIRALADSKPNDDAPVQHVKAVLNAVDEVTRLSGKDLPDVIVARLKDPTNANIEWVASQVHAWESDHNDLLRGYSGSGGSEKRQIQAQQAALSTVGQIPSPLNVKPMQNPFKAAAQQAGSERNAMLQQSPELTRYLAWRKLNAQGDIDEYLRTQRTN